MRTITPELTALLRSRFQGAGSGYAGRLEIDNVGEVSTTPVLDAAANVSGIQVATFDLPAVSSELAPVVLVALVGTSNPLRTITPDADWVVRVNVSDTGAVGRYAHRLELMDRTVDGAAPPYAGTFTADGTCYWGIEQLAFLATDDQPDNTASAAAHFDGVGSTAPTLDATLPDPTTAGNVLIAGYAVDTTGGPYTGSQAVVWPAGWTQLPHAAAPAGFGRLVAAYKVCDGTETGIAGVYFDSNHVGEHLLVVAEYAIEPAPILVSHLAPLRINLNRNLRMGPDQASIELANEDLSLGWGPTSVVVTGSRCRVYQWYGDPVNEVLTFTGVIDKVGDNRDPLVTSLECRSLAGPILVDQTFSATGPQGADEEGHVRTEDNGVYLSKEVDYIAGDVLERAGWPSDLIDVKDTSFVLDEFLIEDGASWWDTLARLAGFVGYDLWDDEDGFIRLRPLGDDAGVDDDLTPDYSYEIGIA